MFTRKRRWVRKPKTKKTAEELAALVRLTARVDRPIVVRPDGRSWNAYLISTARVKDSASAVVERATRMLRKSFDLEAD